MALLDFLKFVRGAGKSPSASGVTSSRPSGATAAELTASKCTAVTAVSGANCVPQKVKRCPNCQLCPLPADISYYWGASDAERAFTHCKACRGKVKVQPIVMQKKALILVVEKLRGLRPELIREHLISPLVRDNLRLRDYRNELFVSDGEDRIWRWANFPGNRDNPMDWDGFLQVWPDFELWEPTTKGMRQIVEPDDEETTPPFDHIRM